MEIASLGRELLVPQVVLKLANVFLLPVHTIMIVQELPPFALMPVNGTLFVELVRPMTIAMYTLPLLYVLLLKDVLMRFVTAMRIVLLLSLAAPTLTQVQRPVWPAKTTRTAILGVVLSVPWPV